MEGQIIMEQALELKIEHLYHYLHTEMSGFNLSLNKQSIRDHSHPHYLSIDIRSCPVVKMRTISLSKSYRIQHGTNLPSPVSLFSKDGNE